MSKVTVSLISSILLKTLEIKGGEKEEIEITSEAGEAAA
jgi:hypothetical protein